MLLNTQMAHTFDRLIGSDHNRLIQPLKKKDTETEFAIYPEYREWHIIILKKATNVPTHTHIKESDNI
jgi:hypothetical protein